MGSLSLQSSLLTRHHTLCVSDLLTVQDLPMDMAIPALFLVIVYWMTGEACA